MSNFVGNFDPSLAFNINTSHLEPTIVIWRLAKDFKPADERAILRVYLSAFCGAVKGLWEKR